MQITVKITPQSSANKILGFYQGMLKIALVGVPEKGKLNEKLIDFLADCIGVPKKAISLKQGLTNPIKKLEIDEAYALKVEMFLARYKPSYDGTD